jgi:hypothetical protein
MSYVDTETKMKIEYDNIMSDIKNIEDIDTFYIADDFTYYMSSFNFSKPKCICINSQLFTNITEINISMTPIWLDYENDEIEGYSLFFYMYNTDFEEIELEYKFRVDDICIKEIKEGTKEYDEVSKIINKIEKINSKIEKYNKKIKKYENELNKILEE